MLETFWNPSKDHKKTRGTYHEFKQLKVICSLGCHPLANEGLVRPVAKNIDASVVTGILGGG